MTDTLKQRIQNIQALILASISKGMDINVPDYDPEDEANEVLDSIEILLGAHYGAVSQQ